MDIWSLYDAEIGNETAISSFRCGRNELHTIFERHFADFCEHFDEKYAATYGRYRLGRIRRSASGFVPVATISMAWLVSAARILNAGWSAAIAAYSPMHPGHDYFRPFSCKGFYLCPSCSRKRTIPFAEHLTNDVLLKLPHRQFVVTIPKALRPSFSHEAVGRPLLTGMVIAHQSFGDQLRWNPHFHPIVLEGGFDDEGMFFYIPFSGLQPMVEVFRRRVIKLLMDRGLLNEDFGRNLPSWKHSGFSIDNSVRILDHSSQESLAEYIARPPRMHGRASANDQWKCGAEMKCRDRDHRASRSP